MNHKITFLLSFLLPSLLIADTTKDVVDLVDPTVKLGQELGWISIIPFIAILLSIAIFPLINHHFWEKNFGKISAFWAFLFFIPFIKFAGFSSSMTALSHAMLEEYIPFIVLLFALFTISGGIVLRGNFVGTPGLNLLFLIIGTILASWMGTTGAAMLLIRPLIRANKWRKNKVHIMVFFIFLVANIGGSLTPLGDPPLFIGFLKGVKFFWTTEYMFMPMLFVSSILMILFYIIDNYYFKREINDKPPSTPVNFSIEGKLNFILLFGVIISVLLSGMYDLGHTNFLHLKYQNILRDITLLILGIISYKMTSRSLRDENGFTWFPIVEVAKLFAGIFITIIPVIAILKAGDEGILSGLLNMTTKADNITPNENMYFWLTGFLSSFLDNAPTYFVFFNSAGGENNVIILMDEMWKTLLAISSGAVFMGAMTYIGNAPNFMVRSIAEENKIKMPSFFGYMVWSCLILIPIFLLYSLLWFF